MPKLALPQLSNGSFKSHSILSIFSEKTIDIVCVCARVYGQDVRWESNLVLHVITVCARVYGQDVRWESNLVLLVITVCVCVCACVWRRRAVGIELGPPCHHITGVMRWSSF